MTPDRRTLEKILQRHLSLFGSPSVNQVEASRARTRERLRAWQDAAVTDAPLKVRVTPVRYAWRVSASLAVVAVLIIVMVDVPSQQPDWLATVEAADGSRYTLEPGEMLRSVDAGATLLALKDGSRVETRSQSELSLERAADGIAIRLRRGGVIVDAAEQHRGHLYVHTQDMTVAVIGTMFVVNAEASGSRVTVIEGEVRVREGSVEKRLKPGEQVSSAALARRPMRDEIAWSVRADAILANFAKGMANTAGPLAPLAKPANALNAAAAQTPRPERLEFESASMRPCDPDNVPPPPDGARGGGVNSFNLIPGRLRALCLTVATLIRTAYGYGPIELDFLARGVGPGAMNFGPVYGLGTEDGRRVRGGPDWVRSDLYTIEAVVAGGVQVDAETLRGAMLQRLLERRLQLKAHVESEGVPAFALTVAKGGLKIKPVSLDACDRLPGRAGAPVIDGFPTSVLTAPRSFVDVRAGQKPSCGMWGQRNGPNMVLVGGGVPVSALVNVLGSRLGGVRILDHTGFTADDRFNFVVEFAVDDNAPGLRAGNLPAPPDTQDVPPAATIFTALEEQLGLRLERAQTSREFIVIDHVERPSPN